MKKHILTAMLLGMTALNAMAQGIVVHQTNDAKITYNTNDVNRIEFTNNNVQTTSDTYATRVELKNLNDAIEAKKADRTALDLKADKTELADKADKAALDLKADKTALEAKADKTALEAKADKTALEAKADKTELDKKADKTALEAKADKTVLETKADMTALETKADKTALETKADKTALEAKADKTELNNVMEKIYAIEPIISAMQNKINPPVVPYTDAVDLGLSVKWATYNVGATKPEEAGGYYAWGETEEKTYYDYTTYKHCDGNSSTLKKYNEKVDNKALLDPEDDVASVKWGGSWRMPTLGEITELAQNCTTEWTTVNGVVGRKYTSKINGNSIFFPASGTKSKGNQYAKDSRGYFWSKSGYTTSVWSYAINFLEDKHYNFVATSREQGFPVRPVCPKCN